MRRMLPSRFCEASINGQCRPMGFTFPGWEGLRMRRIGKTVIVWAAVLLTVVDPVSAGRWHRRCCAPRCCYVPCNPCVPTCCSPCGPVGDGCNTCMVTDGVVTDGLMIPSQGPTPAMPQPSHQGPIE